MDIINKDHPRIKARRKVLMAELATRTGRNQPGPSHPDFPKTTEAAARDDLVVKELDHRKIWAAYNRKAGGVQHVVPAGEDD